MTIDEMEQRIQEIEKIRRELADERDSYRKIIGEQSKQQEYSERLACEGKCYKVVTPLQSIDGAIAFKIIKLLPPPHQDYARCIIVAKKYIKNEAVDLWMPDIMTKMYNPFASKRIDHLGEITESEFNEILQNQLTEICTYDEESIF